MGKLSAKLHGKRGASLVIALVFMLVCLMLGAVCLGAASANAGRFTHLREDQASYLAVRSAAELLRDDIKGAAYGITQITGGINSGTTYAFTSAPEPKFFDLLDKLAQKAYDNDAGEGRTVTLTITFEGTPVTAKLYMENNIKDGETNPARFGVHATLYKAGAASTRESYMRLYIPASVTERVDKSRTGSTETTKTTTAIVWDEGSITKVGGGSTP